METMLQCYERENVEEKMKKLTEFPKFSDVRENVTSQEMEHQLKFIYTEKVLNEKLKQLGTRLFHDL